MTILARLKSKVEQAIDTSFYYAPNLLRIEKKTNRKLTIETELTSVYLAKYRSQMQSPLFRLPAEIRNIVFALAILPHGKTKSSGEEGRSASYGVCPIHSPRQSRKPSTGLPMTCRRVWLETNALLLQQDVNCFSLPYGYGQRRSYGTYWPDLNARQMHRFSERLSPLGRRNLNRIHIFAPNEKCLPTSVIDSLMERCTTREVIWNEMDPCCRPRLFTLTIRLFVLDDKSGQVGTWGDVPLPWNSLTIKTLLDTLFFLNVQTFYLKFELLQHDLQKFLPYINTLHQGVGKSYAPVPCSVPEANESLVQRHGRCLLPQGLPQISNRMSTCAGKELQYCVMTLEWEQEGPRPNDVLDTVPENPISPSFQRREHKSCARTKARCQRQWRKRKSLLQFADEAVYGPHVSNSRH